MRRVREDPRRIGAKRRREESAEFPEPPAAKEGSARKVAATEAAVGAEPRVSFLEEIRRFSGQVTVRTADGSERELPPEVAIASPGLQSLLERHDRRAASRAGRDLVFLRQPDCTADMLRRVEISLRCASLPEDLEWPSEEAWSFLRCVAFLGVPVLLDAVARKAAQVLVDCMLEPEEDAVSGTFGQAPPGALHDPVLEDTVGLPTMAEVQACVRASRALGARAAEAAAASLANAEDSPLRGVGGAAVLRVLRAADEVMEAREELQRLEEASTELEALAALRAVADARFLGCRAVVEAALRHLRALDSREILDQGLTVLEATLEPSDGPAASSLAEWVQSPCGLSAGWEARGRAMSLLLLAAPEGHREATDVLVAAAIPASDAACGEASGSETTVPGLREAAIVALPSVAPKGDSAALEAVAVWLLSADCEADRLKGLEALEQLADGAGPTAALSAVATCLVDESGEVRRHAVAALGALAERGDPNALEAARAGRASNIVAVRTTAVEALGVVATWGSDEGAVADLCALLSDPSPEVRDPALAALAGSVQRGLSGVCGALGALLEHKSWAVRARALAALGRAGEPDDEELGRAIAGRLEDQMLGVRAEVPGALELLVGSERANQAARRAVEARLANSRWAVRQAAAAALAKSAPRGDREAEARLVELLKDSTASVREHALAALVELAVPGAEGPAAGLVAVGADRDPGVRATGLLAAAQLLPRGCGAGVALAVRGLSDACPPVRERAASALGCLAGDQEAAAAVEALAARLEDISDPVRRAAAASLLQLVCAVGHSLTALAQVKRRCEHPSQGVRRVAEAACAKLEELCLRAGDSRSRNDEELTPTPPQGPKVEPPAEGETPPKVEARACIDTVARGLGGFIVGLQSKEDAGGGEKQADPVTRGLEMFLAELKKRVGPVCALQVPAGAPQLGPLGSRPPPTPAAAGVIFRPPLPEKEEDEGSVKEEPPSELEPASPRPTAASSTAARLPDGRAPSRSETRTGRSPSRYSASMTSPQPSRARSRSPRLASSLPAETAEEDVSRGASSALSAASEADEGGDGQEESEDEIELAGSEAAASDSEELPDSDPSDSEAAADASEALRSDSEAAADASEALRSDSEAAADASEALRSESEAAADASVALNSDSEAAPHASEAPNTDSETGQEARESTVPPRGTSRSTRSDSEAACGESQTAYSESAAALETPQAPPGVEWVDLEPSDEEGPRRARRR